MAMYLWLCFYGYVFTAMFFFLVGYVEPWWPIQNPNKGRKKKEESEQLRG